MLSVVTYFLFVGGALVAYPKCFRMCFCVFVTYGLLLAQFIPPSYDTPFYFARADAIDSFREAVFYSNANSAPTAGVIWLVQRVLSDKALIVVFINAVNLATAVAYATRCGTSLKISERHILFSLVVFLLYPSIVQLLVSANKDLFAAVYLAGAFYIFSNLCEISRLKFVTNLKATAFYLSLLGLALVSLSVTRGYLAQISAVALGAVLLACLLEIIKVRKSLSVPLLYTGVWGILIFLLSIMWNEITVVTFTYSGNAAIPLVYEAPKPTFGGAVLYGVVGPWLAMLSIFAVPFLQTTMSAFKLFAGMFESFVFLALFCLLLFKSDKKKIDNLLIVFVFLHMGLQIWGSPNFGSLFRHRAIDFLLFAPIALNTPKSQLFRWQS